MKIFDNNLKRANNGFACFRYRDSTIFFNDEEAHMECWYLAHDASRTISAPSVQDAIESINNLERKLAEA